MHSRDFAILIGLPPPGAHSAAEAAAEARRVAGDVAAMRAWMLSPQGGKVPPARLRCITAPPMAAAMPGWTHADTGVMPVRAAARPLLGQLEHALAELEGQARRGIAAGRGPRLGRRLTLYMAGQVCLPGRSRLRSPARPGAPMAVNAWLAWAQFSGMFREVVLWLDCGMTDPVYLNRRSAPLPPAVPSQPGGPAMVVLAARQPQQPAEIELAGPQGGRRHGAFTWALLEGLRGAAADAHGRVTGRGLADWLRHAQAAQLPADAPPTLAREPDVIQADAALVLAEGVAPPHYPVRLRFPPAALGQPVRLWHGAPPRLDPGLGLARSVKELALPPGLYVVEVPGAGLRQGFAVAGPTGLAVTEGGPAVRADALGRTLGLTMLGAEPTQQCLLVDSGFGLLRHGIGELRGSLPFGLYRLCWRQGRSLHDKVVLLDRDLTMPAMPTLTLASPVVSRLPALPAQVAAGAVLRLIGEPRQGITVVDSHGLTVLDLDYDAEPLDDPAGEVSCSAPLPPGSYFLRRRLGPARGGATPGVEQSLVLSPGWALEVTVPSPLPPAMPAPVGLLMRPLAGPQPSVEQDRLVGALSIALADRRRILHPALEAALFERVTDPLAGLLAGHLLLLEQEFDPGRDISGLNGLVRQLRRLLGPLHPDVKALALRCPDVSLRPARPLPALPMFLRSWRLLVAASHQSRSLLPRRFWERALARTAQVPFLAWSMDGRQRQAVQRELAEATWGDALPPQHAGAVRRDNVLPFIMPFSRALPVKSDRGQARRRALLLDVPLSALDLLAEVYDDHAGD